VGQHTGVSTKATGENPRSIETRRATYGKKSTYSAGKRDNQAARRRGQHQIHLTKLGRLSPLSERKCKGVGEVKGEK